MVFGVFGGRFFSTKAIKIHQTSPNVFFDGLCWSLAVLVLEIFRQCHQISSNFIKYIFFAGLCWSLAVLVAVFFTEVVKWFLFTRLDVKNTITAVVICADMAHQRRHCAQVVLLSSLQ